MEDRYLFKAKRTDNEEWVHGNLITKVFFESGQSIPYILCPDKAEYYYCFEDFSEGKGIYEVTPSTICQCTGLKDKNENLIWENDIVFVTDCDGCSGQIDTGVGEIDFLEGLWYISGKVQNSLYDIDKCFQLEVIGNIFDDPELLDSDE